MFGIAQGPAKQTATDTINTLSGRLQSATLLEDRRNAVLGLRSFSRTYPASVASGSLRDLIGCLGKDAEDVDTIKLVLETLLMLFNPDSNSPEASEEIALWLADEFTQRQENITILLDLLGSGDFYARLYSLQLLTAILSSRTERTEECIFTAPLGISRLVATLDDRREAVRNEGLSLLTFLTPSSAELQKLVAFENAFDRIFTIIESEGSLAQGDRVVEDCLILLANLLRMNTSNQSFFRETKCVPRLAQLFGNALREQDKDEEIAEWAQIQRNRNVYALLAVLRLFLVKGGAATYANQASFWQHGVLKQVLQLAFSRLTEIQIRAEALVTCADLIRGNSNIQEGFAQLQVTAVLDEISNGASGVEQKPEIPSVYVIDGLLDLILSISSPQAFDARLAACECIKAYFYKHPGIKMHFLRRAIDGHTSGADETANVLTTLLRPGEDGVSNDPYRYWLAAVILFHLIYEDGEAKALAMSVSEGDASGGEEVITCVQTVAANLIEGMQKKDDSRVSVAYLMLLCAWLFEDPDAINDFLGEGSNLQSLVQAVSHNDREAVLTQGLCAMLLGIVYEFSTKDSPVPRATIHSMLTSRLGRDRYIDHLSKLRRHPILRDFEVLPQKLAGSASGGLPDVFFDQTFVDFAKDNFSRILRAIDRDPGYEIPVISNGVQKGISREMVDSLRAQLEEKANALQKTQADLLNAQNQLSQERIDSRKVKDTAVQDLARIKSVNEALHRNHEGDIRKLEQQHSKALEDMKRQLAHVQRVAEGDAERIRKTSEAEIVALKREISTLQASVERANEDHLRQLQTANDEWNAKWDAQSTRLAVAEDKAGTYEALRKASEERLQTAEAQLQEREKQRSAIQTELDDLLMVFGDLEEKAGSYKKRLRHLGEDVSDGDTDEDDEITGEGDTTGIGDVDEDATEDSGEDHAEDHGSEVD